MSVARCLSHGLLWHVARPRGHSVIDRRDFTHTYMCIYTSIPRPIAPPSRHKWQRSAAPSLRRLCAAQASTEASRRCATAAARTCCRRSTRRRCRRRWPTAMPALSPLSRRRRTPAGSCSGRPQSGPRGPRLSRALRYGCYYIGTCLGDSSEPVGLPRRLAVLLASTPAGPEVLQLLLTVPNEATAWARVR